MEQSSFSSPDSTPSDAQTLSWRRWPLRENGAAGWGRAGLVFLVIIGMWLVLLLSLPPFAALLIGSGFALCLLPYFLPTTYTIGPDGVRVQDGIISARLKPWRAFGQVKEIERGYWLVSANLAVTDTIAPLRAVFLPYPLEPALKATLAIEINRYLPLQAEDYPSL